MANPYIPTGLTIERYLHDKVIVNWDFPAPEIINNFTFNVYASLLSSGPIAGPAVITGIPRQEAEVQGISGTTNFYLTVSSTNINTLEESNQSVVLFVSLDHTADGIGGAVAKSTSDVPKFIRTTEDGSLAVTASVDTTGLATEAKQDVAIALLTSIASGSGFEPFFDYWEDPAVLSNVQTSVYTFVVPALVSYYITGLYITGQGPCLVELNIDSSKVFEGRIGDVEPSINPSFIGSGLKVLTGETIELFITQDHTASLGFSGNVFGYIK